jgi:hypothetical protein
MVGFCNVHAVNFVCELDLSPVITSAVLHIRQSWFGRVISRLILCERSDRDDGKDSDVRYSLEVH